MQQRQDARSLGDGVWSRGERTVVEVAYLPEQGVIMVSVARNGLRVQASLEPLSLHPAAMEIEDTCRVIELAGWLEMELAAGRQPGGWHRMGRQVPSLANACGAGIGKAGNLDRNRDADKRRVRSTGQQAGWRGCA